MSEHPNPANLTSREQAYEHAQRLMGMHAIHVNLSPEDAADLAAEIARIGPGQVVALEPCEPPTVVGPDLFGGDGKSLADEWARLSLAMRLYPAFLVDPVTGKVEPMRECAARDLFGTDCWSEPKPADDRAASLLRAAPDTLANGRPPLAGLHGA